MTLNVQFLTMAAMVSAGIAFGIMLDTYQRFLNRPRRKGWIAFVNDILFWVVQALLIFYVLFLVNKGEIRFYIFVALLCGFAAYQALMKQAYLWILEMIIKAAIKIGAFLANTVRILIFKPITLLIQLILGLMLFLGKLFIGIFGWTLTAILSLIRVLVLVPVKKIILFFWKLLPKGIKKPVEKLYNSGAGILLKVKNVYKRALRWNRKKD